MKAVVEKQRVEQNVVGKTLVALLSNTYVLYVKTQNFHWNIDGARFYQLHKFFEKQYNELAEAIDEIAEQLRILNLLAPGSMQEFLQNASICECKETLTDDEMLQELHHDHVQLQNALAGWIKVAQDNGDEGTADLLIQRLRAHSKLAWMIGSHLE